MLTVTLRFCIVIVFSLFFVPFHVDAANLKELPELQKKLTIREIYRIADKGKILSNKTFGLGASEDQIREEWGEGIDGEYPQHGVGLTINNGVVTGVHPVVIPSQFYPYSDSDIVKALGDPEKCWLNEDESIKIYRYITRKNHHQLLIMLRKRDSENFNQMDYVVVDGSIVGDEFEENLKKCFIYPLILQPWKCNIL